MTDTTALAPLMTKYYDRLFIKREMDTIVLEQFSQKRKLPQAEGQDVVFSRYLPLARATTPLTEGANPTGVDLSSANVSVTVKEYGNWTKISKRVSLTAIDPKIKEASSIMSQNAAETIDRLIREELFTGATPLLANSKGALSSIAASDTLNASDLRKAVRNIKKNKARRFSDGYFVFVIGPDTAHDLMGDSVWVNAHTYKDGTELYKGELGRLHGARCVETTDQKSEASTVTVYSNFLIGADSYGTVELKGDERHIYVTTPGPQSTDNPLARFGTIGWAQSFAVKVLVATWIINLKTAASA